MAAVLTTIYAEVVKTAAIRKFSRAPMRLRLRLARPAYHSFFRDFDHLGFYGNAPSFKAIGGASKELRENKDCK